MGKSLLGKLGGIGVAIAVALGLYFFQSKGEEKIEEAKAPDVGDCVYFKTASSTEKATTISCGDAKSTYKVASDDGKCDDNETSYRISLGTGDTGNVADLCLTLDAAKGDCFEVTSTSEKKVDCASSKGAADAFKVVSVGKSGGKCATPAQPIKNKTRNTLLCLSPNA